MKVTKETIHEWLELKAQFNALQEKERILRCLITDELLGDKKEGSKTVLVDDVKVTATAVMNYTIDQAELNLIFDSLTDEEKECIKYVPELKMREYRKLPVTSKLAAAVVSKPSMAQFKVLG